MLHKLIKSLVNCVKMKSRSERASEPANAEAATRRRNNGHLPSLSGKLTKHVKGSRGAERRDRQEVRSTAD